MSLILLALAGMFHGSSEQFDGGIRLYAAFLGLIYDVSILVRIWR